MGSGKWKISFHRSPSNKKQAQIEIHKTPAIPVEFLCPISGSIMADPVIVSSGHTFERNCVRACVSLSFKPTPPDGAAADFTTVIPNLALRSAIQSWCRHHQIDIPKPIDFHSAEKIVSKVMPPGTELARTPSEVSIASSDDRSITPLPFSCYSSSSSSEIESSNPNLLEEEFIRKLKSNQINEQEEALISLRKSTRNQEEIRLDLCTTRLLSALKTLISSRYSSLQINAAASLVNLSLEKQNKVKIVRSGIVPLLIDLLIGGCAESQENAAGALFSLSIDDQNKTAIGVLGALPPLLHALRSDSERTRDDSALCLYHLSLVHSNRVKMIKLGSIQSMLSMVKSGHMSGRVMLILCNFASSVEGRAALLNGGAVECLVSLLGRGDSDSVSTRENCLAAIHGLSYGGLRFKGLAKEAGAEEVLKKVEETGDDRLKEMARRILEVMNQKDEEDEEIDWEELLNSEDDLSRTLSRSYGFNS